ncbi:unnamed protein product [Arctia plantaginis]|uniref:Uncharacterized protein n=1 Tax=Arctia plantaginis TaxID=874455 RepID=A0A8S1APJ2_ARCPL|nr:unnamed protein product [Arctia plantaginis]
MDEHSLLWTSMKGDSDLDSGLNLSRAVTAKGELIKSAARLITKPRRVYGRASRVPDCRHLAARRSDDARVVFQSPSEPPPHK